MSREMHLGLPLDGVRREEEGHHVGEIPHLVTTEGDGIPHHHAVVLQGEDQGHLPDVVTAGLVLARRVKIVT